MKNNNDINTDQPTNKQQTTYPKPNNKEPTPNQTTNKLPQTNTDKQKVRWFWFSHSPPHLYLK